MEVFILSARTSQELSVEDLTKKQQTYVRKHEHSFDTNHVDIQNVVGFIGHIIASFSESEDYITYVHHTFILLQRVSKFIPVTDANESVLIACSLVYTFIMLNDAGAPGFDAFQKYVSFWNEKCFITWKRRFAKVMQYNLSVSLDNIMRFLTGSCVYVPPETLYAFIMTFRRRKRKLRSS
jgi:hypothetical protein